MEDFGLAGLFRPEAVATTGWHETSAGFTFLPVCIWYAPPLPLPAHAAARAEGRRRCG